MPGMNSYRDRLCGTAVPLFAHKAPVPEPIEDPLPGEHPIPQEDPVPSPNPEIEDPKQPPNR